LPAIITEDFIASRGFRQFILGKLLTEMEVILEGKI